MTRKRLIVGIGNAAKVDNGQKTGSIWTNNHVFSLNIACIVLLLVSCAFEDEYIGMEALRLDRTCDLCDRDN